MRLDDTAPCDRRDTVMLREALEAPDMAQRQFAANDAVVSAIADSLGNAPPRAVVTCARGSSDCAATYLRYLIETRTGILTSSLGLSVASVYGREPDLQDTLFVAISQSGRSPDLLAATAAAARSGARTLALVNDVASPLAALADWVLPLQAGPEHAVAATKSFVASLLAGLHLVSRWSGDPALITAMREIPAQLTAAAALDWTAAMRPLAAARSVYILGRGPGLGIAQEAALKLKETCRIPAEAFSAAEVLHGPLALAGETLAVVGFGQDDQTRASVAHALQAFAAADSRVISAGVAVPGGITLPGVPAHPLVTPILAIQSFYRLVAGLSVALGLDPDAPAFLNKVTESL